MIYPLFIWLNCGKAFSQSQLPLAYKQVLNLEFENSRLSSQELSQEDIPFFDVYLQNLADVLELFLSENKERYEELENNETARLKRIRATDEESPYHLFFQAEIKLQWAFIKLKFGEQWNAAWALRSAYKTIRRNIKKYPDFVLNQKSMGLLHIIFGAVPARHQWLLGLFGLEGDVMLGLDELKTISQDQSDIFNLETRLISSLVFSYLLEDHHQAQAGLKLDQKESLLAETFISSLVLMKAHKAKEAQQLLSNIQSEQPLFKYLLAETYFQEGKYEQAKTHYQSFLDGFEGLNNVKDAHFKKSLCLLFTGDLNAYSAEKEKAMALGKDYSEVDKNAADLLSQQNENNQTLLQLRYAIDGGFYLRAYSLIGSFDPDDLTHYELVQLKYRKARLSHLTQNVDQAILEYGEIIQSDNLIPETYFAPNSLLQLGHIYLERGESDKATMYLKRVLKFRKHPYKNSLDSKAKIALAKIKQ